MQSVKNRIISHTPIRTYTDELEWHPDKHALCYLLELDNGEKCGSSGGQNNAKELGAYGCIVDTHNNYSKRSESKDYRVKWLYIDKNKIVGADKLKNASYDKLVHEMIFEYDPRVKYFKHNSDALAIDELDANGDIVERPLTYNEYLNYLDTLFKDSVQNERFPLDVRQQKMVNERKDFLNINKDADMIINIESNHTRAGKDKTNYKGINSDTQVIFDFSGYFATFQITSEFDSNVDVEVVTRGKTKEEILQDTIDALVQGKRPWLMISTYNNEESDRIQLLSLFKNANIEIIIDEVDYQVWKQTELLEGIVTNVIA
jgi:hypothetical protein